MSSIKRNDTYEYRKNTVRPVLDVNHVEIGLCTENVLLNQLKKPFNGRFYFTNDTHRFFYDFDNKRYELFLFGEGGGGIPVDLKDYAKKKDIPTKVSQLVNDANYVKVTSLGRWLSDNNYVTKEMLENSLSQYVTKSDFENLSNEVTGIKGDIADINSRIDEMPSGSDYELEDILNRLDSLEANEHWEEFVRN